ncbi:MAG: hypothetical protein DBX61_10870 [Clostridiales bacterium]|nr:MAG: hypothetical protein DBX61_10870 [Clostridiales bacterium]
MCSKESNSVTPGTIHPLLVRVDFTSAIFSSSVLPPLCFTASAAAVSCRTYGSTKSGASASANYNIKVFHK